MRRAGPAAEKIAEGFRADAFSYLLFLRLVPVFPFWLLNLVSALCGVRLAPFAAATVLGIMPATFAFAVVGSGLESVIVAEESARWSWKLVAALAALGVLALVPILAKRLRVRFARDTR
jgi:uncharacterized membrane protein YdjX (TVP38/TMEM64 family)